eukprot:299976-Rhodomonas_salina.1
MPDRMWGPRVRWALAGAGGVCAGVERQVQAGAKPEVCAGLQYLCMCVLRTKPEGARLCAHEACAGPQQASRATLSVACERTCRSTLSLSISRPRTHTCQSTLAL